MTEEINEVNDLNELTRDPVRGEGRRLVEIDCAVATQVVPGGHMVKRGKNRLYMYQTDLAKTLELVRPEAEIEKSVSRYNAAREALLARERDNARDDSIEWSDISDKWTGAPTAAAHVKRDVFHGDGVPPLRSVEVVNEETYPPPKTNEAVVAELQTAGIADAVGKAIAANSGNAEVADLRAEIAELKKLIASAVPTASKKK